MTQQTKNTKAARLELLRRIQSGPSTPLDTKDGAVAYALESAGLITIKRMAYPAKWTAESI